MDSTEQAKPTAYSFIRFSSARQADGDSLKRQTEARDAFIAARGLRLDTALKLHDKRGVSAFRGKHRSDKYALGQFEVLVRAGSIKPGSYLLVENLDRLSREEVIEGLRLILNLLHAGIIVVQLSPVVVVFAPETEGEDMTMKLMIAIMELRRGNSESAMRSVRNLAAWRTKQEAARTTRVAQTSKCPHWLQRAVGRYEIIEERAAIVRRMFELCVAGHGINTIIAKLVEEGKKPVTVANWSVAYVGRILSSRTTIGEYQPTKAGKPFGEPVPGYYPAVVTEQQFYLAQLGLSSRRVGKRSGRRATNTNFFSGLLQHALDGDSITYKHCKTNRAKRNQYAIYINSRSITGQAAFVSFPAVVLQTALLECIREIDPMDILPGHDRAEDAVLSLVQQVAECDQQLGAIEEQIVQGSNVAVLAKAAQRIEDKKKLLLVSLADARQKVQTPQAEAWAVCSSLIDAVAASPDLEDAKVKLQAAVRRVVKMVRCLFVRVGKKQLACCQMHFHNSEVVRSVFVFYRGVLTGVGYKRPPVVCWKAVEDISPTLPIDKVVKLMNSELKAWVVTDAVSP